MTTLVDLRQRRHAAVPDIAGLRAYLAQLVGEPFRFARVSYGDELTLHFGDLRPPRSARSASKYGAYILGLRASPWILKSGSQPSLVTAGVPDGTSALPSPPGEQLRNEDLERGEFVAPDSRVLAASPVASSAMDGFALEIRTSDGSVLFALPDRSDDVTPAAAGGSELPGVADWELLGPRGLVSAWPGLRWTFEPFADEPPPSGLGRTA